jgi:glycosyltransferase involved in cell wall biosynthesis
MVSKGMYVQTRSGRFGHRSVCYLASGRPVIAQDTGLDDLLPQGAGLLTFTTVEEAADAACAIERDYDHHARGARRLAESYFDSADVLTSLTHKLHLH